MQDEFCRLARIFSPRRFWRFVASHESAIWSYAVGMACFSPVWPPLPHDDPPPVLRDDRECRVPQVDLTPDEQLVWARLTDELGL